MKVSLILAAILLLSTPLIFAGVIYTDDTTLNIEIYNNTLKINDEYSAYERTYDFNVVNGTNSSVFSDDLVEYATFTFVLSFDRDENVSLAIVDKYASCLNEKAECETLKGQINTGFNSCVLDRDTCLEEYEGENATSHKIELDSCNLLIRQKDIDINSKNEDISDLEKDVEEKKYAWVLYGVIGIAIGILGLKIYKGEIGEKAKEKSATEFNPQTVG